MTHIDFTAFSLSERIHLILRTGFYLNQVEYPNFNVQLYSISDFFVEVKIDHLNIDVESARVISGEDVEKYLGPIELPIVAQSEW